MTVKLPQPSPFFAYTHDALLETAEHQIATSARVWDQAARIPPHEATFASAIQPLLDDENAASVQGRVLWFLSSASPDRDVRAASKTATVRLKQDVIERFTRADVFAVVDAVAARELEQGVSSGGVGGGDGVGDGGGGETTAATTPLTPEARVFLRKLRAEFADNGLAIAAEEGRARLKAVNLRLAEAQTQYLANLNADVSGLWLTELELDGLSPGTLERFPQRQGEEGGEDQKSYFINFKRPNMNSVLSHVHNAGVRRWYYIAWDNRLKDNNGPLLGEMLRLRREAGQLLGFRNYSESQDHNHMLSTEQALAFLASLKEPLQELAREELEQLSKLKEAHLQTVPPEQKDDSSARVIFRWDTLYYKNLYKMEKSKIDTEKVS
jgi:metallopeptidase MepB